MMAGDHHHGEGSQNHVQQGTAASPSASKVAASKLTTELLLNHLQSSPIARYRLLRYDEPQEEWEALADVLNQSNIKDVDEYTADAELLRFELSPKEKNSFDPRKDVIVAEDKLTGEVVAFGYCFRTVGAIEGKEVITYTQYGFVRPSHRRQGIGSAILDFTELRSSEVCHENGDSEDSRRKRVTMHALEGSPQRSIFSEKRGYLPIRFYYLLSSSLLDGVNDKLARRCQPPEGITIEEGLSEDQWMAAYRAKFDFFLKHHNAKQVFSEDDAKEWHDDPRNDDSLHRIAWAETSDGKRKIVGVSLNMIDRPNNEVLGVKRGWINELGVAPEWRGKGLGGALIYASAIAFRERKMEEICLGVDGANPTNAQRTYMNLGFSRVTNNSITIYEKAMLF